MTLDALAIAAHPDDIEQTCGGTLLKLAEAGHRTGALDLTAGDMGTRGTPEQRIAEAEEAARCLSLAWRGNLRFPDARLENTLTARMTLAMKNGENYRPFVVEFLAPVRTLVRPVSEGLFAGALDISKVPTLKDRVLFRLSVLFGVWREGDHRDWKAIRGWAESLVPRLA